MYVVVDIGDMVNHRHGGMNPAAWWQQENVYHNAPLEGQRATYSMSMYEGQYIYVRKSVFVVLSVRNGVCTGWDMTGINLVNERSKLWQWDISWKGNL